MFAGEANDVENGQVIRTEGAEIGGGRGESGRRPDEIDDWAENQSRRRPRRAKIFVLPRTKSKKQKSGARAVPPRVAFGKYVSRAKWNGDSWGCQLPEHNDDGREGRNALWPLNSLNNGFRSIFEDHRPLGARVLGSFRDRALTFLGGPWVLLSIRARYTVPLGPG